jgi:toluene monooxygenase system ferredoxin subunit
LADLTETEHTSAGHREESTMTWKRICDAAELAENSVKQFGVDGIPIVVVNYGEGFRAIPPICPHMEEPLAESGVVARCVLTCTKHLWAWDLRTLEMQGETERPLKTYETREENGALLANIESELTYEFDAEDNDSDDDFFK